MKHKGCKGNLVVNENDPDKYELEEGSMLYCGRLICVKCGQEMSAGEQMSKWKLTREEVETITANMDDQGDDRFSFEEVEAICKVESRRLVEWLESRPCLGGGYGYSPYWVKVEEREALRRKVGLK